MTWPNTSISELLRKAKDNSLSVPEFEEVQRAQGR
jgi:hypothetical protein